jgi:predicted aspartyl protease
MSVIRIALLYFSAGSLSSGEGLAIPIRPAGGFALVDGVYLNGTGPYRFLLDTGAQSSTISSEVVTRLGMQPRYAVIRVTTGSEEVVPAYLAAEISLGPVRANDVELLASSMQIVRRATGPVDGILGQNFLERFPWLLDRERETLIFDLEGSIAARLSGKRTKVSSADGRMLVPARIGGKKRLLVLDSGASHLILFTRASLTRVVAATVDSNGGAQMALSGAISSLQVGDVELEQVPAAMMPVARGNEDGLLPVNLFRSIYVDAPSGFVILNPR